MSHQKSSRWYTSVFSGSKTRVGATAGSNRETVSQNQPSAATAGVTIQSTADGLSSVTLPELPEPSTVRKPRFQGHFVYDREVPTLQDAKTRSEELRNQPEFGSDISWVERPLEWNQLRLNLRKYGTTPSAKAELDKIEEQIDDWSTWRRELLRAQNVTLALLDGQMQKASALRDLVKAETQITQVMKQYAETFENNSNEGASSGYHQTGDQSIPENDEGH